MFDDDDDDNNNDDDDDYWYYYKFLLFAPQNCAFNGCGDFEFDKLGVDRDKSIDKRFDLEAKTMCIRWRRRRGFRNWSVHLRTYNID